MKFILIVITIGMQMVHTQIAGAQQQAKIQIVNLSNGEKEDFQSLRENFKERNVGYDINYLPGVKKVEAQAYNQVLFVQEIKGVTNQEVKARAVVKKNNSSKEESETIVGDILILNKGESMETDAEVGLLAFKVPEKPKEDLPPFIRPDWDPNITDVPGGCATEIDAYRRILLTWKKEVGEYIYHALNAHRVRMYDSFSHYHPVEGGFDEFYLVQMVKPGAKIITSEQVEVITNPDQVREDQLEGLITEYELEVGDLVYLPRGVMHRGFNGVLAQVITVPGFIPGSEIGLDHHLRAINERFNLNDDEGLPYNEEHSHEAVIR